MKMRVTSAPVYCGTEPVTELSIGDVIEVADPTTDSDGDVFVDEPGAGYCGYVALTCLTPAEAVGPSAVALAAAFLAKGLDPTLAAEVLALAAKIEGVL